VRANLLHYTNNILDTLQELFFNCDFKYMSSIFTYLRDLKRRRSVEIYCKKFGDNFTINGLDVSVPKTVSTSIRYLLLKKRPYEREEMSFALSVLKNGTNIVELGGSIGVLSRVIRNKIGLTAKHFIVEANPNLLTICKNNSTHGAEETATEVIHGAIAYVKTKTVAFATDDSEHSGKIASLEDTNTINVPVIQLSNLTKKLPRNQEAILICDIEGGEYEMFLNEPRTTFQFFSYAVVEIHPKVFKKMGYIEKVFLSYSVPKTFH
jgi:FkbM family methyltransferase